MISQPYQTHIPGYTNTLNQNQNLSWFQLTAVLVHQQPNAHFAMFVQKAQIVQLCPIYNRNTPKIFSTKATLLIHFKYSKDMWHCQKASSTMCHTEILQDKVLFLVF
ncbi:hypothetical protein XENTR_v10003958 [Xenopus tropicalis]|nr:hypothetical protein XENTR_v10003958 [Xenopus tropicalis]